MIIRILTLIPIVLLSACGFTPMHDPGLGIGHSVTNNIDIHMVEPADLEDQEGAFWLQQALFDRLGDNSNGAHVLEIRPDYRKSGAGITADDVATRLTLTVNARYALKDKKDGKVLDKGRITYSSVYGATREPYGQESAYKVTLKNVSREAADRLIVELASYYASAEK